MIRKWGRVLAGILLLLAGIELYRYIVGTFPTALLLRPVYLLLVLLIQAATLVITKGYGVLFRSVHFLVSDKLSLSESEFQKANAFYKSLSKTILISSVVFALFHLFEGFGNSDAEIAKHWIGAAIGDVTTGLMLVLLVINPVHTSLELKFYENAGKGDLS